MDYDFAAIKAEHPVEQIAERLGMKLTRHGQTYRCPCPITQQGGDRAITITPTKGLWYSFPAQKGGDVLALVSFVRNCNLRDAAAWIVGTKPEKSSHGGTSNGTFKPVELVHDHPSVLVSGIEAEDAKRFGLGFREPVEGKKRAGEGHILVPVFADGKLAGYIGCQEVTWLPDRWRA